MANNKLIQLIFRIYYLNLQFHTLKISSLMLSKNFERPLKFLIFEIKKCNLMLTTKGLVFGYSNQKKYNFPNLECPENETLLIIGPSGSGKTTLLNILALIKKAHSGSLMINGTDLQTLSDKEIVDFRANNIGIVFQKNYFINALNVEDNLLIANYFSSQNIHKDHLLNITNNLGITELLKKKIQFLSGGEQQRVSIARALMNNPKLILADEPTSSLDDDNCHKVISLLESQAKIHKAALVIVTHDARLKNRFNNQINLEL